MSKRYEFQIWISGEGNSPEDAWEDAYEALAMSKPGPMPEDYTEIKENCLTCGAEIDWATDYCKEHEPSTERREEE